MSRIGRVVDLRKGKDTPPSVLGLDCSTSTIGFGLISLGNKLLAYGHLKPIKADKATLIERLAQVYADINMLCNQLRPSMIAIEDIKKYMPKSTAQTITILASFNRVVAVAGYNFINDVEFYSEAEVRKVIKNHYLDKNDKIEKTDMPDFIINHISKKYNKIKNKRNDNIAVETFDESDGIAVALCRSILEKKKNGSL